MPTSQKSEAPVCYPPWGTACREGYNRRESGDHLLYVAMLFQLLVFPTRLQQQAMSFTDVLIPSLQPLQAVQKPLCLEEQLRVLKFLEHHWLLPKASLVAMYNLSVLYHIVPINISATLKIHFFTRVLQLTCKGLLLYLAQLVVIVKSLSTLDQEKKKVSLYWHSLPLEVPVLGAWSFIGWQYRLQNEQIISKKTQRQYIANLIALRD